MNVNDESCLGDETLSLYLEGRLEAPLRMASEQHMVECDQCRGRLVRFMRVMNEGVLEEEESAIDDAIARFTVRYGDNPTPVRPELESRVEQSRIGAIAAVAAALVVALGGAFFWLAGPSPGDVLESLLAERRHRPRFSMQEVHSPFSAVRAPLDGEDGALEAMMTGATDLEWGVFFVATGDYERGLPLLERAVATGSAAAHNDLGLAYMLSDQAAAGQGNVEAARREFQAAIAADPAFATPLFNMAILLAREGLNDEATDYAMRYAALDPDSGWTDELEALEVLSP